MHKVKGGGQNLSAKIKFYKHILFFGQVGTKFQCIIIRRTKFQFLAVVLRNQGEFQFIGIKGGAKFQCIEIRI